jgi:splicing factor 4
LKRERKSRWSDEKIETHNLMIKQDPALVQYAIQVFGNTDLSADQWKQLEDQRKMKMLFEMLQKKQKEAERLARAGKVKYEYDSDEDVEEGTWEHKRRKQEMKKTQLWAEELTDKAHGKHHIGDFMPPEELEKFMQKWESLKEGKPMSSESDYKDSKLQSDNKGFQMLQKLGWVEGQGLGSSSTGIAEPVNKSVFFVVKRVLYQSLYNFCSLIY